MPRMAMKACVFPCLLCFSLCLRPMTADKCVNITVPATEVTLDANSSLTEVHFEVVNSCNESLGAYRLAIKTSEGNNPQMKGSVNDLCVIRRDVNSEKCRCDNTEKGLPCYAKDTFTRQPARTWEVDFSEDDRGIARNTLHFSVLYPAKLRKISITNNEGSATVTMDKGNTAQFKCHGDWGNPASTILLRGPQNNLLHSKQFRPSSPEYFSFSKANLSCSDSGQYRCEVNGTDQYKAVTLLVKCRLVFKERHSTKAVTVKPGGEASVSFNATTYTMDISPCQLKTPAGKQVQCNNTDSDVGTSHVTVSGSLPDVVITVKLTDVTEKGICALTASNPTGSDTVQFNLSIPDPSTTIPTSPTSETTTSQSSSADKSESRSLRVKVTPSQVTTTIPTSPTPPSSETTPSQSSSAGGGTPPVPSPSPPDQSQESRTKWIIIGIVGAVVLLIIVVILLVVCIRRRKKNCEPKRRVSPNRRQAQPQEGTSRGQENEMIVNSLYATSDPQCEMITNELYGMSGNMPNAPSADGGAIYELADETRGATTSAHPCRPHAAEDGGVYVDQEEIQRNKARNKGKAKKEEGGVYVDQQEIQRKKARNKAKAKKEEGGVYVDQQEIQRNKARNKAKEGDSQPEEGGVYVDQQEIQRNKARNKAKAKKGDSQPEDGGVYVDQQEIQRNKARNKAKAKEGDSQPEEGGVYVDQQEKQRNKARNKAKAKKGGSQPGLNPGDSEGVYGNA